jgi:murein DD-endopeptidase MepM/ murein hydrolase activator NlpD
VGENRKNQPEFPGHDPDHPTWPESNPLMPPSANPDVYRQYADEAPVELSHFRTGYAPRDGWHNHQDTGAFNSDSISDFRGLHPGEDWNYGKGADDVGRAVYAAANGKIVDIKRTAGGADISLGWTIIILHDVPHAGLYYSIYSHVTNVVDPDAEIELNPIATSQSKFGLVVGEHVKRGKPIARIANINGPHLHFEVREFVRDLGPGTGSLYPTSHNGKAYYDGETVKEAIEKMRAEGIIDPSDFLDLNGAASGAEQVSNKAFPFSSRTGWAVQGTGLAEAVDVLSSIRGRGIQMTAQSPVTLRQVLAAGGLPFPLGSIISSSPRPAHSM